MVKVCTSYFYMVRFMKPNEIPLSTAVWDPQWFNEFKGQGHTFIDKNGVVNGLRIEMFKPGAACDGLCRGPETCAHHPPNDDCPFLHEYRRQLSKISKRRVEEFLDRITEKWQKKFNTTEEPTFVFLFHEAPNNPCSERWAVQDWFGENGIPCDEYKRHDLY